ncbi:transmembrane and TPR repeat-containing protein [Candidatus Omnitrophus magneticus]|uniref:Transmembrane and TPR repeat-containing protein n=1 Tax=Candidatus Omnitrophus magneticus TaxID=1609969 RepID=A0A0F0CVI3_9BACT|nr:transmembrane and TPR repeat-containing protein [Candidatus Omnitrophus magneticus]
MNKNILTILGLLFCLIIAVGVAYSTSLHNDFIWDDFFLVKDNQYIKSWEKIPKIFSEDIGAGGGVELYEGGKAKYGYYRPLQILTYLVDYSIWGVNPIGFHLSNTLFHLLTSFSIFFLILILFKDKLISFLTALLFAIHPIHTEAVSYISGRADSLAVIFMILAFIFYIKFIEAPKNIFLIGTILSYLLALLSRENTLFFPVIILIYHYTFKKNINKKIFASVLTMILFYIAIRLTLLKHIFPDAVSIGEIPLENRLPGFFTAVFNYIKLLFWPAGLHMEYVPWKFSYFAKGAVIGAIIIVLIILGAITARKKNPRIFFALTWFFLLLIPVSNCLYPVHAYMREHWLYLPSIGFFLMISCGFAVLLRKKIMKYFAGIFLICLTIFFIIMTREQNSYWKDMISFCQKTLLYEPYYAKMHYMLGNGLSQKGLLKEAITSYTNAINYDKSYADAYYNLANIYLRTGNKSMAVTCYENTIKNNPNYGKAYNNLANLYMEKGRITDALPLYKKTLEINPNDIYAINNLACVYRDTGENALALDLYNKAIALAPVYPATYYNAALTYKNLGNVEMTKKYAQKWAELSGRAPVKN